MKIGRMEVDDRRTPEAEVGPQIAAGRDATIHDAGAGRVLRRTAPHRDLRGESIAMEHLRTLGYPVPRVHRVGPGEQVLERIEGPTMLDDIEARPWKVRSHARLLARLHAELHALPAPDELAAHPLPGTSILHLDLHPGNVLLSPRGPIVIDWSNVRRGPAAADVALTWIIVGASELDHGPITGSLPRRIATRAERLAVPLLRRDLVATFVRASGIDAEARAVLLPIAALRLEDPNVRPGEADEVRALVRREVGGARTPG